MSLRSSIEHYRTLQQAPIWKLLASDNGPQAIAILQTLLYDNERVLPASVFFERLRNAYAEGLEETLSRDEARTLCRTAISFVVFLPARRKRRSNSRRPGPTPSACSRVSIRSVWGPPKAVSRCSRTPLRASPRKATPISKTASSCSKPKRCASIRRSTRFGLVANRRLRPKRPCSASRKFWNSMRNCRATFVGFAKSSSGSTGRCAPKSCRAKTRAASCPRHSKSRSPSSGRASRAVESL